MILACTVLLLLGNLGFTQAQGYLPPTHNTVTRTVTNTITARECLTKDTFVTRTQQVINQESVIVTLCTKSLVTETVHKAIVTPVNDQVVVRSITQNLYPITSVVTDVVTNGALRTVTDTAIGTLTHRSIAVVSTTQIVTQTQTLTQTTLVVSTQVNNRVVTIITSQTVFNTIFVSATPIQDVFNRPAHTQDVFNRPAPIQEVFNQGGANPIINGQVFASGHGAANQGFANTGGFSSDNFNQGGSGINGQVIASGHGAANQGFANTGGFSSDNFNQGGAGIFSGAGNTNRGPIYN